MSEKFVTVFHKSQNGDFLVEVKRYRVLYAARRWARQHPEAEVFVRINVGSQALPLWSTFVAWRGHQNVAWAKLSNAEVLALPELLAED
jgi:hypothetical protein